MPSPCSANFASAAATSRRRAAAAGSSEASSSPSSCTLWHSRHCFKEGKVACGPSSAFGWQSSQEMFSLAWTAWLNAIGWRAAPSWLSFEHHEAAASSSRAERAVEARRIRIGARPWIAKAASRRSLLLDLRIGDAALAAVVAVLAGALVALAAGQDRSQLRGGARLGGVEVAHLGVPAVEAEGLEGRALVVVALQAGLHARVGDQLVGRDLDVLGRLRAAFQV